jgi:hypothetical protein
LLQILPPLHVATTALASLALIVVVVTQVDSMIARLVDYLRSIQVE